MLRLLILAGLLAAGACTTDDAATPPLDPATPAPEVPDDVPDATPPATNGWRNTPIPFVAYHHDVTVAFTLDWSGGDAMTPPIDAVVGLADGMATDISELGPLVRLGPDGFVEVRDGAGYRADAQVDYRGQPVAIVMRVNLEQRRYGVDANGVRIATDYAFNAAQAGLFRIDTLALKTETAGATVELADVEVGPEFCSVAATSWVNLFHPEHAGTFRVQFEAEVPSTAVDAVVGLAGEDSERPTDLAATVRFSPAGTFEAGNAGAYAADRPIAYAAYTAYRVSLEVDVPAKRYSVFVSPKSERGLGQQLAGSYAFRPEQDAVAALSKLALFTTGSGYIRLCNLMVWDY